MEVKEESEKVGLNIQKTKIMASGHITSWEIDGETVETVTDYFGGLQNHCRWWLQHEIKRRLLLGRKVTTNLDSILKNRDITLPTKVRLVKAVVFPVVMYWMWELDYKENWVPKNWCFWTMVLEKTLESPLVSKEIQTVHPKRDQSILNKISPRCSLEGLMLKLQLQYFGHLMGRTDSFEKTLMLGKIEGRRRRGHQRMSGWMASLSQWTWVWVNSGSWWWTGRSGVLQSKG